MVKKLFYICVFLFTQAHFGLAQDRSDSTYSDYGISIGLNSYQIKEKVLNNIRHTGFFPSLGFSYEWYKKI